MSAPLYPFKTCRPGLAATLCVVAALAGAVAGCAPAPDATIDRTEGADGLRGMALEQTFDAPEFTLADTEGRPFDFRAETRGSLALLFFGYTHCPDICPVQMSILDAALTDLAYGERAAIDVVFVTTDPARDTPERMRAWLDRFDTAFIGLTGEIDAVNEIQAGFNLPPAQIDPAPSDQAAAAGHGAGAENYYVGHATPVVAITGDGVVRAFYPSGIRQTDWRHDLPLLLSLNQDVSRDPAGAGTQD